MDNISAFRINDKGYPQSLKKISNPPKNIYYRGILDFGKKPFIAVVGTRKCSDYGKQAVIDFVNKLGGAGFVIVSGLARGIDGLAHKTALQIGAKTIAVLGSGVDEKSIYPRENANLAKKIIEAGGAILSEYPAGTPAMQHHFPQRNRIIAGLSGAILVIEAKKKSGSLITASFGFSQKKPVFSVPGSIYSLNSEGCHLLIKNGAKVAHCGSEILEYFKIAPSKKGDLTAKTEGGAIIIKVLRGGALHIDKIIQKTKLSPSKTITALSDLELEGNVKNLGGNVFSLNLK